MNKKAILVTVDTEGDNLWDWKPGNKIDTKNAKYIEPFQLLCEKFGFYPTYLINYEMAMSEEFVLFAREKAEKGLCEIGMHVHAWNSPPEFPLEDKFNGNPYIIEYPKDIIYKKHEYLKNLIYEKFGTFPVSYRSGRWSTNDDLFKVLDELGFLVDCSVTPGINHKAAGRTVNRGNNYPVNPNRPYKIGKNLIEMPMTTGLKRSFKGNSIKRKIINIVRGEQYWLRPALQTTEELLNIVSCELRSEHPYLMFMIHSSELMPGGSPYCKTQEDVNAFLGKLEIAFKSISNDCKGYSLKEYYHQLIKNNENEN